MIQSISVTNDSGESIKMVLTDPYKTGFLIESVDGLGPPKMTVNTTELAGSDGAAYNSSRATTRNIVFRIRFVDVMDSKGFIEETIEDVRQKTYKYFALNEPVKIKIKTDNRTCETTGYVESNEPDIFSKEERAQISIICPDPYLYTPNRLQTLTAKFEFPFSKEIDDDETLNFGELSTNVGVDNYYDGDVESGLIIHFHATGNVSDITFANTKTESTMFIDTSKFRAITKSDVDDMINGDDIYISTVRGNRYIRLLRDGVYYNALSALSKTTQWPTMKKGNNVFVFTADSGVSNLRVDLQGYIVYEGI